MWRSTAKRRRLCEGGSERRRAQRRPFWTLVADVAKLDGLRAVVTTLRFRATVCKRNWYKVFNRDADLMKAITNGAASIGAVLMEVIGPADA